MNQELIIQRSFENPVAVLVKREGVTILTQYYLFGEQVHLHEFKKRCKSMRPIEIISVDKYKSLNKEEWFNNQKKSKGIKNNLKKS